MQKYCAYCGKPFEGRANKKFDSDTCRVKYSNLPKRMEFMKQDAIKMIDRLRRAKREYPHLENLVNNLLEQIEDELTLQK